ncbi:MAG TPA: GGDEF domain-containing protein [Bryobacteraceae bacterium]|nr:GGDEF domain-containing protein [Bryobacteraceae bacterium]
MISIRNSMSELERCHQERTLAVECYQTAIQNLSHYTIELDKEITEPQRKYLAALAESLSPGTPEALEESQATLRGLLRDYRDKAAEFLNEMREELVSTTRALEEILDSLSQTDGDQELRLRNAMSRLRDIATFPEASGIRATLLSVAGNMEDSLEQIRKQHQLAIAEFQVEIRMLHKRIDSLEVASSIDQLTKLFNRQEIEQRIRASPIGYCMLLARVSGMRLAEVHFGPDVAGELAGAFAKRLRNSLPITAVLGRWSKEEFVALLTIPKTQAINLSKVLSEQLSGSYSCLKDGKTVRPALQLTVAVVESVGNTPERMVQCAAAFLTGD